MATKYIQRYTSGERTVHWIVAASFLLLTLTGFGLFDKRLSFLFALFGGGANAILIHKYTGIVFFVFALKFTLSHAREVLRFDASDVGWIKVLGGYLNKKAHVPPMGKYNTGQKVFGIFVILTTLVFGLTAIVLWNPAAHAQGLVQFAGLFHSLCFVVMAVFFVAHIYLGTIGVQGGLEAMTRGAVSEAWARKYSPLWLEEFEKNSSPGKLDAA